MPSLLAHPDYTRERVRQVARRAAALVHADARAPDRMRIAGPVDRIPASDAAALDYRDAEPGMALGPLWATWWLAVEGRVPAEWEGEQVDLLLVTNSEATLWLDGEPVQGLVSGGAYVRPDAMLAERAVAGEELSARVEIACNGLFGWSELNPQPHAGGGVRRRRFRLERCELARFDREAWALSRDLEVLAALMDEPGADDAWRGELLRELNRFCNAWDAEDRATWPQARAILGPLLERAAQRDPDARDHRHRPRAHRHGVAVAAGGDVPQVRADVRDPGAAHGALPGYRFACSQAQQYAWIRDRAPGLWARIRERVAAGQWLPVGGTWVEPDCNLPAGESLVRQFVYGQRFFERELGRRARVFWNPDVFGYNGQLPQIMRGAGIDGFLTQKLSWNRFNPPEHHTFRWVGIDGSAVLAHFPPADTYNAEATVPELRRAARDFKDHALSARSLLVFGWGDGGGGPTAQMLETLARVEDLQDVPRTTIGAPEAFFAALADEAQWPEVVGELYLEYHRGTYTTQARTKRASRRAERALHDAELLAAVSDEPWPREELDRAWQTLLLNHFHDILPGSSIGEVHERAERDLAEVEAAAGAVRDRFVVGEVVNTVGVARREVVSAGDGLRVRRGAVVRGRDGSSRPRSAVRVSEAADGFTLENEHLRAVLGRDGTLRSLVELASGREAMAAPGNVLELYEDRPTAFEAWDLDPFHLETRSDCPPARRRAEVAVGDPLRAEVVFERPIGRASRMRQTVRLDAESSRLEFHCAIDWHEDRRALKVRFPVAVHAPARDLRDAVRRRRAPDPLLDPPRPRPVRGPRPPLRRPLRARLRRRPAVGGDLRLVRPRRGHAHDPAALAALAGPRGRHRPPRPVLRDLPAPRELAGRRRHRRGPVLQRAAAARRARGRGAVVVLDGHPRPLHRHRQARRGRRRPHRPPLRGPRRSRRRPPARRPPVHRGVVHQPPGGPPRSGRGRRRRGRHPVPAVRDRDAGAPPAVSVTAITQSWRRAGPVGGSRSSDSAGSVSDVSAATRPNTAFAALGACARVSAWRRRPLALGGPDR